jgi:hypothetical protein
VPSILKVSEVKECGSELVSYLHIRGVQSAVPGMARLAEYLLGSSPLGIFHAMKRWKIAEE